MRDSMKNSSPPFPPKISGDSPLITAKLEATILVIRLFHHQSILKKKSLTIKLLLEKSGLARTRMIHRTAGNYESTAYLITDFNIYYLEMNIISNPKQFVNEVGGIQHQDSIISRLEIP